MRKIGKSALRYRERCCVWMRITTVYDDKTQEQIDYINEKLRERENVYKKMIKDAKFQDIQLKLMQNYRTDHVIADLKKILYDIITKSVPKTIIMAENEEEKQMLECFYNKNK